MQQKNLIRVHLSGGSIVDSDRGKFANEVVTVCDCDVDKMAQIIREEFAGPHVPQEMLTQSENYLKSENMTHRSKARLTTGILMHRTSSTTYR